MATQHLYDKDEEIIIHAKIPEDVTETVTVTEASPEAVATEQVHLGNDQLYNSIKNIFTENKQVVREDIYFTPAKGVIEYKLDNSMFCPSPVVLLQPRQFEKNYLKQLESIIYSTKEDIDVDKLLPLLILFSYVNKKNYPIRIVSSKYKSLLTKVCSVLNNFLNKNYSVIYTMYTTFNSIKDTEEEQLTNQKEL